MNQPPPRKRLLTAATVASALPFVLLGSLSLTSDSLDPALPLAVFGAMLALSLIRARPGNDVSPSDAAIVAGIILLPFGAISALAAVVVAINSLLRRRTPSRLLRDVATVALSCGIASAAYQLGLMALAPTGSAAWILAAAIAALAYVAADLGQHLLLLAAVSQIPGEWRTWRWIGRSARAQLFLALGVALAVEVVRLQPLFAIPGLLLVYLGYVELSSGVEAERRASVLANLVDISHTVGSSPDQLEVFRAVYAKVRASVDVDAFYVALLAPDRANLSYELLIDRGTELAPMVRSRPGTLAGVCIGQNRAILLRDIERDARRLGFAEEHWGTVNERSVMVVPLRARGEAIGAVAVHSASVNAYGEGDLEFVAAIANEAAIAIERASLYERSSALSDRLVDLHQTGLDIGAQRELPALLAMLAQSIKALVGAKSVATYLDPGPDSKDFVATGEVRWSGLERLPKSGPLVARAMEGRTAAEATDSTAPSDEMRRHMAQLGHGSVAIYPLRAADESVGIISIAWDAPRSLTHEERDLLDLLTGIGASAIRSIRLYGDLDEAYLSTVQTLMTTIQARDGYGEEHQRRVAADAVALGERVGLPEESLRDLRYASLFHALGKISIPLSILSKVGPLTGEEQRIVREHPQLGARIVESIAFLRAIVPIVRHANERWDGSGYPDGLSREAIPRESRILQIALSYGAMLADRPYRRALDKGAALAELRLLAGTRYDPALVDVFAAMLEGRGTILEAERQVHQGARELAVLAEIAPEFNTLTDVEQLLNRVLTTLIVHLPARRCVIALQDQHTGELVARAIIGEADDLAVGATFPKDSMLVGCVDQRKPLLVDDVREVPGWAGEASLRSMVMVPLVNEDRAIGALYAAAVRVAAFSQSDLTLLLTVGAQVAAAIQVAGLHEQLRRAATTDALTGLHNYRYFYDRLDEEIARAVRRNTTLAVAYFDIDNLKRINDAHGHLAGDAILRALGVAINTHLRREDVPARYGGDEFAIVMPETPRDEAERAMQRLMELLDRTQIELPGGITLAMPARSWGVSSFPIDGTTSKELVENADTRAYANKRAKA